MLTRLELKQISAAMDGMTKFLNGDFMLQKTQMLKLIETFTEESQPVLTTPDLPKKTKNIDGPKEFSRKARIQTLAHAGIEDIYQANEDIDCEDDDDAEDKREY